jgi:hypothetical protein
MAKKPRALPLLPDDDPDFARFWAAYPLRISRMDARRAWGALAPSQSLIEQILAALAWQREIWSQTGFGVPYPATWLRAERWTDEQPSMASYAKPAKVMPWDTFQAPEGQ